MKFCNKFALSYFEIIVKAGRSFGPVFGSFEKRAPAGPHSKMALYCIQGSLITIQSADTEHWSLHSA